MSNVLATRALRVTQSKGSPLYMFFVKGKDILDIADISRISKDNEGTLLGYQRGEVRRHVSEIVDYLDSNSNGVLFPNAIILAMSSEIRFKRSRGPKIGDGRCDAGLLEIPLRDEGRRAAWIVDGQQRTLAIARCRRKNVIVPVTAFVSDDFEVHRTQFLLVNKVQPLPSGLINELLPAVNTALPPSLARNKIPSAVCDILHRDPESPFFGLIRRQTTKVSDKTAVIKDNSLIQVIRSSLNSVHGCLYQYKNVATGEIDVESVIKVLNLYWDVVREMFPDAWGMDPRKSRLMGGVGITAMGVVMDRVMGNILPDDSDCRKRIVEALSPLKDNCAWSSGVWQQLGGLPWNHLQNTTRDKKLLSNTLIRIYTGVAEL